MATDADGNFDSDGFRQLTQPTSNMSGFVNTVGAKLETERDFALPNDFTYVFRIAGEARYVPGETEWLPNNKDEYVLSRVQAVRYVAVTRQPVFRYVIFYAQKVKKVIWNLNSGPALRVRGSIQANGAIYTGGSPTANGTGQIH